MKKRNRCFVLYQGQHGNKYILAVFLYKKDAVKSARENGKYKFNKDQNIFMNDEDDEYRIVSEEFLIHKPLKNITICGEIL